MEATQRLPLIQLVRDYFMNTHIDYEIENITREGRFTLFHNSIMGIMYGIVLNESESYLAKLIQAETFQSLSGVIKFGYDQGHNTVL